jgi:hypothetical protein
VVSHHQVIDGTDRPTTARCGLLADQQQQALTPAASALSVRYQITGWTDPTIRSVSTEDEVPEHAADDLIIGTAVEHLLEDGDEQAAALLLDVISFRAVYIDTAVSLTSEEMTDHETMLGRSRCVPLR